MILRSRFVAQLAWALCISALLTQPAAAFCGFYVSGADSKLYANATMVVLMRDGTKTVLSMQNNYDGPPEQFALVIPVPTVLTQDMVKTLPRDVFARVDALGAPRLVEYWETDPCLPNFDKAASAGGGGRGGAFAARPGVQVEASFAVGEYDIVILSANDSSSLAGWLTDNHYNIPSGASGVLEPYVASGTKFFVAKVDPARVSFENGQAALAPLRFHYDSQDFSLPIRLGLLNSRGQQDLIVNILAPDRYEVSNRSNVTIPTNIRVQDAVRDDFPGFYEALFARVLEKNPNAVVTEYAWNWNSCDPCPPGMMITGQDLATLGADVTRPAAVSGSGGGGSGGGTSGAGGRSGAGGTSGRGGSSAPAAPAARSVNPGSLNYTLTRLHYRYVGQELSDDLVFERAEPLLGGRGTPDRSGELSMDVSNSGSLNNFQGRYVILHPWSDAPKCQQPERGYWGGPPSGSATNATQSARNTALTGAAPKAAVLPALIAQSLTALEVTADKPLDPLGKPLPAADGGANEPDAGSPPSSAGDDGCGCNLAGARRTGSAAIWYGLAGALGLAWLRRRRVP